MSDTMAVEIVYALQQQQTLLKVKLPVGATVTQAIQASGILAKHPEIDLATNKLGIFGKLSKVDAVLLKKFLTNI